MNVGSCVGLGYTARVVSSDNRGAAAQSRRLPFAREGYPLIAGALSLTLILFLIGWKIPLLIALLVSIFTIQFFRDPERPIPAEPGVILSPADGRVIKVAKVRDDRFLNADVTMVSIFMSPLNVHVNRIPFDGQVIDVRYKSGSYYRAYADNASLDNEQNAVVLEDVEGRRIAFVQIAGFVARRIVCYLQNGMSVQRGARYGMIKFGSRADIYLPLEAKVRVAVGDKTYGAQTVIAQW